jgi:hypothetical protein
MAGGQRSAARKDLREAAAAGGWDVEHDEDRGCEIVGQARREGRQGFYAAGRRSDDHDVPFRHGSSIRRADSRTRLAAWARVR